MNSKIVNIVLATSNLIGCFIVPQLDITHEKWLIRLTIFASFMMHMSERKHNLMGFHPWNRSSSLYLWMDRIMAVVTGGYLISKTTFHTHTIHVTLFGLLCMGVSEKIVIPNTTRRFQQLFFMIGHLMWHCAAYYLLWWILVKRETF
jgi:hypothetical protein